ncbi:hypothetical protein PanWU01x14_116590, partial [Parasponia andersonii]
MDDHGKRSDAVAHGTFNGVIGHESDFHGGVGDVRVDFHGAPSLLVIDNQTLNLATPGVEISHVGIGDTSFHAGCALDKVDSRLPSVSLGAHGLVDFSAHGLVLGATKDVSQSAHRLVLGVVGVSHTNVDSHGVAIKDSHVSLKMINSCPLASDQGLSFMASKNKGVKLDSSKKVINVASGFKKVQDFGAPSFAQV